MLPPWSSYNHLYSLQSLQNRYYVIRHGQSEANVLDIVLTDPKVGTTAYGLTAEGRRQAEDRVRACMRLHPELNKDSIVLSSDFLRALETARIAQRCLGASEVEIRKELRERDFGTYEGGPANIYDEVWQRDETDPFQTVRNVESLVVLMERATSLVTELERTHKGKTFLLATHGDTALALQTGFAKINPAQFQSFGRFENAEVREMILAR